MHEALATAYTKIFPVMVATAPVIVGRYSCRLPTAAAISTRRQLSLINIMLTAPPEIAKDAYLYKYIVSSY